MTANAMREDRIREPFMLRTPSSFTAMQIQRQFIERPASSPWEGTLLVDQLHYAHRHRYLSADERAKERKRSQMQAASRG
jgi:hypothetical protein